MKNGEITLANNIIFEISVFLLAEFVGKSCSENRICSKSPSKDLIKSRDQDHTGGLSPHSGRVIPPGRVLSEPGLVLAN